MVIILFFMVIVSDRNYAGGKPCIERHRLWVGRIIAQVKEEGIESFVEDFDLDDDLEIRSKIEEAVNYCRDQQCDEDNNNGNLVRYCQGCSKRNGGWNGWEVAQELYELNYD